MGGKRLLLAVALALIVACGGTTPSTSGSATPGGATATAGATSGSGSGSATPAASGPRLSDALTAGKNAQYKITYKYTISGGAGGLSGEQTWYSKPPKSRMDFSTNVGGQTTVVSYFTLADGSYYCMALGSTKTCFKLGAGIPSPIDSNPAAVFQQSMIANPGSFPGVFVENKTFAGQSGACYDVTGSAAVGGATSGRFCYSSSGLLLFQNFTAAGASVGLEATNVSTTVPDSDFELPAKPSN